LRRNCLKASSSGLRERCEAAVAVDAAAEGEVFMVSLLSVSSEVR
jgi:hypothetical protein